MVDDGPMARKRFRFIDLFSGAGLFSHAFVDAGFAPLLSVERDQDSCESYRRNVGNHIVCGDVTKISPDVQAEVLIAGPPCQGFSTLNRKREEDPRNELCLEVIRWAKRIQPKLVIIENVAPFASSPIVESVQRRLKRIGYTSKAFVLDAADFGAAQFRRRTFFFASNEFDLETLNFDRFRTSPKSIKEAWTDLPPAAEDPCGSFYPRPSELALQRFKVVPQGGDWCEVLSSHPELAPPSWKKLKTNENRGVWGRLRLDEPSPTIRTCFQNPSKGRHLHPTRNRVITLREAARIQGIPDSWDFHGTPTSVCRQIGNGVPVDLGTAVANASKALLAA